MQQESETPMWMVDADSGRVTMANRAAERLFGYPSAELASKTIFELVVPEEVADLRESFSTRAFAGHGGNWTLRLPDGTRYKIHIRYHYVERDSSKLQFTFADEIHGHPNFPDGKTKGLRGV